MDKDVILLNIEKIHTTLMGFNRIKKNLNICDNVLNFCKNKLIDKRCFVYRKGKNYYCHIDNMVITINANTYTIITAHIINV